MAHPRTAVPSSRRRLDVASVTLLMIGLVFGGLSCWLVAAHGLSVLVIVPSLIAVATGATHITKREASRR